MPGLRFLRCQCMRAPSTDSPAFSVQHCDSEQLRVLRFNKWGGKKIWCCGLFTQCVQKHVAGRQGFTLKKESYKAYQEPELHVKHIWSDFQNIFFSFSFSCSSVSVCWTPKCHVLEAVQKCRCCLMPILFAEGNPGKVQLLLGADTSSIWHGVFEWMAEGKFASKFNAFTEKLIFLFESV